MSNQQLFSDCRLLIFFYLAGGGGGTSHIISLSVCPIQNGDTVRRFFLENIKIFELPHHNIITLGGKLQVKGRDNTLIIQFGS